MAVPEKKDARKEPEDKTFLVHLADETIDFFQGCGDLLEFVGDTAMAFVKLVRGKAQYRPSDLGLVLESCSGQALPKLLAETEDPALRLTSILDSLDGSIENLDLASTGKELNSLVGDIRNLVNNMDGEMKSLAQNLNEAVTDSREVVMGVHDEIRPIAGKTSETLAEIRAMVRTVEQKVEPLAQSMVEALEELASAARSLRILAEYLEQYPDALLKGKGYQNY